MVTGDGNLALTTVDVRRTWKTVRVTDERDLDFAVHQLHETLRLLALDAAEQFAALPAYVVVPDELALAWDDCERSLEWLAQEGRISESVMHETLAAISVALDENQSSEAFWSREGLESAAGWLTIRRHARQALDRLGLEQRPPLLDWISFAPGEGPP